MTMFLFNARYLSRDGNVAAEVRLVHAAECGDLDVVIELLSKGLDVNHREVIA